MRIYKAIIRFYYKLREPFIFHRTWYIVKIDGLVKKGLSKEEAYKVLKAQEHLKRKGVSKFFVLKGRK